MGMFTDIKNLLIGMKITSKHLGKRAITLQYPEQKMPMTERSRGIVVLLSDKETGELNCTGCMLCAKACPTGAIFVDAPRDENKKRHLKSFVVDHGLCCFCGLCEEACNFCAIKMTPKYEFSDLTKEGLVWDMGKLQEMGRDAAYVDTRKKKVAPAAKPAAPAAEVATTPATPSPDPTPATEPKPTVTDTGAEGA